MILFLILGAAIVGLAIAISRLRVLTKDSSDNKSNIFVYKVLLIVCIVFVVLFTIVEIFLGWLALALMNGM